MCGGKREMERRDRDHSDQINNDYKVQSSVLFNVSVCYIKKLTCPEFGHCYRPDDVDE